MTQISKASAAERMVLSAINMAERGEDALAIHVVAASALNVLRDLIDKSGDEYVDRSLKIGIFALAACRRQGEPMKLPTNAAVDDIVDHVVAGIDAGEVTQASDLTINLSVLERRAMLDYIVRPYNFLKHADRDPLATLDESDIDPHGTIAHALSALAMVSPDKELPPAAKGYLERIGVL